MNKRIVIILALVLTMCIVVVSCTACNFDWALGGDTDGDQTGNTDGGNTDGTDDDTDNGDNTTTEPTFVDKVNEFVGSLLEGRNVEKVVGVYVEDGCLRVIASYDDGKMHDLESYFEEGINIKSVSDAIDNKDNIRGFRTISSYETVPYDSATALLESNDFGKGSQMQKYLDEGYVFSVVAQTAYKYDGFEHKYGICATIMAEKNGEVIFLSLKGTFSPVNASNSEEWNCVTSLKNLEDRYYNENSCIVVTDEWASQVLAQQSAEK